MSDNGGCGLTADGELLREIKSSARCQGLMTNDAMPEEWCRTMRDGRENGKR
jgi:hypothetical protein